MTRNTSEFASRDSLFVDNLEHIVLENLNNEQFGVVKLAVQAGFSRSQLHRKLKCINGKSVSQFIRDIRMREALKLIAKDVATISDISYEVGFSSPTYFNRCFHEKFGFTPGEIKEKIRQGGLDTFNNLFESAFAEQKLLIQNDFAFQGILGQNLNSKLSLAVLPLENLSSSEESMYLVKGMHDAIIGALGQVSALRVISRTSTLKFEGFQGSMGYIAKELGVRLILEGSVYYHGENARVQLQLIDVDPSEQHRWAKEYDIAISEALNIQNRIVRDIANEICVKITPKESQQLNISKPLNPDTYKSYLRGMYFINKSSMDEFNKGIGFLKAAVEKDPADPLAYSGLALGYANLGHGPDPDARYWQLSKAAAMRAISLDASIAEAHAVLAMIKTYYEYEWEEAERLFLKANELNNSVAISHFHYAWHLVILGRYEEAVREQLLAKELDPLTPIFTADMGSLYYWLGKPDKAIAEIEQALELDENFAHGWWALGNAWAQKGMYEQAIIAHKKAVAINPAWLWALGNTYALAGNVEKAAEILTELQKGKISSRNAIGMVFIYTSLGELDKAFQWLDFDPPDTWITALRTWPGLESLQKDSRFQTFLNHKNLPPL